MILTRLLMAGLLAGIYALAALLWLDRSVPPDLTRFAERSTEVVDRDGKALRTFLSEDGFVRLTAKTAAVDSDYRAMLIAFEDKRFHHHPGVDPLALGRAVYQAASRGRIVSGASTLTMQVARLLEPRRRTLGSKLIEMARALQLERRFSKDEILRLYLTLAPMGGNREGVRAGSLALFGHEPQALTNAQAALLVAMPRAPSRLDPLSHPERARRARNQVLARVGPRLGWSAERTASLMAEPLGLRPSPLPFTAPHVSERLVRAAREEDRRPHTLATTLDRALQERLEALAADHARRLGPRQSAAILVVETKTRKVRAYVGSAGFSDSARLGQVDMVSAVRSPGSALKPFIFAMGFEDGILHPATRIHDAPRSFHGYAPSNFNDRYLGDVSAARALRESLNIPAVAVLDQVGPVRFVERLRRHGLRLDLPRPEMPPGLAVALGGVGTTLEDVTRAYAALGSDGVVRPLIFSGRADEGQDLPVLHGEATRADILTILRRVPRAGRLPAGRILKRPEVLAVKTGTSYGFRDAWAFGVNAHYTIGVWVGRADGSPSPGQYGTSTALPLLFRVHDHVPKAATENAPPPEPPTVTAWADLPPGLRYLEPERARRARAPQAAPPRITFPADAATLLMPGAGRPIQLEATGGTPPYRWVVNGAPLGEGEPLGRAAWLPGGPGFHDILVMDARGRRDRAHIRLQQGVF